MPDPATAATIVKAISAVGAKERRAEVERNASGLIIRMLGPAADEIGVTLARLVEYRFRNVGRIMRKAASKASVGDRGIVNPRVVHVLLEEGSYCDNELMAEYLGGVLAGSRTPTGRDDRAVSWSSLITSMSSLQIRAHYLIYRELAARLQGLNLDLGGSDRQLATMDIELSEFGNALVIDADVEPDDAINHSILGLVRLDLLEHEYAAFGERDDFADFAPNAPYERVLHIVPSLTGMELYGWGQGLPGIMADNFTSQAEVFELDPAIPRLTQVTFGLIPTLPQTSAS